MSDGSLKTGTVMQASKLGYQIWIVALYLRQTRKTASAARHRNPRGSPNISPFFWELYT